MAVHAQPRPQSWLTALAFSNHHKCTIALNNHVCLCVCGNAEQNIKPDGLLIKQVVLCSVEQSNRGKIAFRQMYLNLLNVLQHCENWSGIGKEGCVYACMCVLVWMKILLEEKSWPGVLQEK